MNQTAQYIATLTLFSILSGVLFMLIKTWVMNQFIWIREGKYRLRAKDRLWTKPGWVAVITFMVWWALFHILLVMDYKINL